MYNLFYNLIYNQLFSGGTFIDSADGIIDIFGGTLYFSEYLSVILALICTVIVWILCCLVVYKAIKMIGRLFVRF